MTPISESSSPILPIEGKTNVLVTAALPYANNVPHLGNIIGSVLSADVFARYSRAKGNQTLYVCGTDEYGTATETKALEEGVDPETLCIRYHQIHRGIYELFNISFDVFGRTPTPQHAEISQDIFRKLWRNGYIEERETYQPYCAVEAHQSFLADRFIEGVCSVCGYIDARGDQCDQCGSLLDPLEPDSKADNETNEDPTVKAVGWLLNPRCKLDGSTPQTRKTKHCFIKLDELRLAFTDWFDSQSSIGGWSSNGRSIIQAWLDKGLKPRSISRDLKWGVPVPTDTAGEEYADKVFYVWFEACIGYSSITKVYTDGDNLDGNKWEQWWKNPDQVQLHQFMGKDNVQFHALLFPASQIGTGDGWTKIHRISTTEYLNYEGGKFSKSRGIGVFGSQIQDTGVPIDVWRYYLLARRPETSDAEFMWQDMVDCNNNELLKNLGNFCQRVVKFCQTKTGGIVPNYAEYTDQYLQEHAERVNKILEEYNSHLKATRLKAGQQSAMTLSNLGNKLLQDNKVDSRLLVEEPQRCTAVVGTALHHMHLLAHILSPYLPGTSISMLDQLNVSTEARIPEQWEQDVLKPGHKLGTPKHLFHQIPGSRVEEWRDAFGGDEVRKQKEEALAKAAAKKAAKLAKKLKKKSGKGSEGPAPNTVAEAPNQTSV